MDKDKAIGIAQAVQAGTAHVFISEEAINEAMDAAISALDKISRIEDLVEGTIYHFDRGDALDMLYEIKGIIANGRGYHQYGAWVNDTNIYPDDMMVLYEN